MSGNYRGDRSLLLANEKKNKNARSMSATMRGSAAFYQHSLTFVPFFFSFFFYHSNGIIPEKLYSHRESLWTFSPSLSLSNRVHGASIVKTSRLATKALKHGGRLSVESRDRSTIARELLVRIKLRTKRLLIKTFKQYLSSSYYSRSAFHATSAVLLLLSLLRLPKQ